MYKRISAKFLLSMADVNSVKGFGKKNSAPKELSKNLKKRNYSGAKSYATGWPSENHCVVNFYHPETNSVDTAKILGNEGSLKGYIVVKKNDTTSITKIEMSSSVEAEALWKKYSSNPPAGVISVNPERNRKTLGNIKMKPKKHFDEYWTLEQVEEGIKNGDVVTGCLRINSRMFVHAFISDTDGRDILIDGLSARNRSLDGDLVAVKFNDENEWIQGNQNFSTSSETISKQTLETNVCQLSLNTSVDKPMFKHARKTGKVVAIMEKRNCRITTGHIKPDALKSNNHDKVLFSPIASTFPRLLLHKCDIKSELAIEELDKVVFVAKIKSWSINSMFPIGELGEIVGNKGEIETETKRILIEHNVDDKEFTEEVNGSFPHQLDISEVERKKRRDFTDECIFTIDPSTAKDLDDALHCKKVSHGRYEVGVHIADVSHFVKPESKVDEVASQRCTSVYLVQKVIPMLPPILCEELCSLNPGSEKLAFSVVWTITEEGKIESEWFGRSIIRSCAKLSYDHAQSFINNPTRDLADPESRAAAEEYPEISCGYKLTDIQEKVLVLHKISQNLRRQRFQNGALQLDQVKLSYTLSDNGLPTGCYAYERKPSNELIEEFMLLANIAVAHKIYKAMPAQAFLRCHPHPKEEMMSDFVSQCRSIGLEIDSSSSESLSRSIEMCCGNDDLVTFRRHALFMLAIKPQQLAVYFCAGMEPNKEAYRHYALNVPLYTHFTSPIRRYADVIVHRQLAQALRIAPTGECTQSTPEELHVQAQACNQRKYSAKLAQELSVDLFLNLLVNNYGPFESKGMVMNVNDRSIDVLSMEYGVVKRVYVDAIPGVMYKLEQVLMPSQHQVNSLLLKWYDVTQKENEKTDNKSVAFDENVDGVLQRLDTFSVVKIKLMKQNPESATSIRAVLFKPSNDDQEETGKSADNFDFSASANASL